jgi:hypothetical protein
MHLAGQWFQQLSVERGRAKFEGGTSVRGCVTKGSRHDGMLELGEVKA